MRGGSLPDALRAQSGAERAERALSRLLAWTSTARDAWTSSRLSEPGLPVEFVFGSVGGGIRYTAECASPRSARVGRLQRAVSAVRALGVEPGDPEVVSALRAIQADRELRWGAWVGGRHDRRGDRFKVYVEVPAGGEAPAREVLRSVRTLCGRLPDHSARLRLIGYSPAGSLEGYYEVVDLEPLGLRALMCRAGLGYRGDELFDFLGRVYPFPLRHRLPARHLGVSYRTRITGSGPLEFTFFARARSLLGGDGPIRRRLLELARNGEWPSHGYEELSRPLADRHDPPTLHTIVSFSVREAGGVRMSWGLAPTYVIPRP